MTNMLKPFVIAASILAAAPAFAQDDATQSAPDLDLGTPAVVAQENPVFVKATHGDWQVRCIKHSEDLNNCEMYQQLVDGSGHGTAEISLFNLTSSQGAAAAATILTPLETQLEPGLTISIDDAAPEIYQFSFCTIAGCVARVGFTASEIEQFKKGNAGLLKIVPAAAPTRRIDLNISLAGFTAAYSETSAENEKFFAARNVN